MQAGDGLRAHPKLNPFGAHQRRHLVGSQIGFRVYREGGAAGIVAVKSVTRSRIQLSLVPGAKNQVELGACFGRRAGAGVGRIVAVNIEMKGVNPHTRHGPKLGRPLGFVFKVQAQAAFQNMVGACGGNDLAGNRAVQTIVDVVVLKLQASSVFRRAAQPA